MKRLSHRYAIGLTAGCLAATLLLGPSDAVAQGAGPKPAAPPAGAAPAPKAPTPPAAATPATPATPTPAAQPATPPPVAQPAPTPTPVAQPEPTPVAQPAPTPAPADKPAPEKAAAEGTASGDAAGAKAEGEAAAGEGEKAEGEKAEGEGEKGKEHWYDSLGVSAFIDSYFSLNFNFPKPQSGTNFLRANDVSNGFALSHVGLNAVYEADPIGGTIYLRFGPHASAYGGRDLGGSGLEYVRQGFATWKPMGNLTLDIGKFDTYIGAEGLDSQDNFTYTRGLVHWLAQPTFHTGLRVSYNPMDQIGLVLLAANGWNNTFDNNSGKTFGLQVKATPNDAFFANLGYIFGPEQDDTFVVTNADGSEETRALGSANKRFKHIVDLVVGYNPSEELSLLLNADFGAEEVVTDEETKATETVKWFGVALAGRYAINDMFAAAARFEFYKDPNGYTTGFTDLTTGEPADVNLMSGTLTLEAAPSPHLSIKLDGRFDYANGDYFQQAAGYAPTGAAAADDNRTSIQPTITLGVVAKTD